MERFRIHGPSRLAGTVSAAGAKNAALPALAASLLSAGPITLERLPKVRDIRTMRRLLRHLGVESKRLDNGSYRMQQVDEPALADAPYELVKTMRASVLVLGPLVARYGNARVSLPGGCAIGVRPIDQHLAGLEALGAEVTLEHGYVSVQAKRLRGTRFRFSVPTVTGTENLLMAATLAEGTTVLDNCAREPEITDLSKLLVAMGAKIDGAGTETLTVEGIRELGSAKHAIIPDRIEGGTYLVGAALTGGKVRLENTAADDLAPLLEKLEETGCDVQVEANAVTVSRSGDLKARDIVTSPHPGFPTDLQAQYMALMTAASGVSTICETVFENRFQHVSELARMGADIHIDGSYARVHGPTPLSGARVMATDLRASACLVLAAVTAQGESTVDRIYHLDRGYEMMERKLQHLGAQVERIEGEGDSDSEPTEPGV